MTETQFGLAPIDSDVLIAAGAPVAAPAMVPNPVNLVRSSRVPSDDTNGRWVNGFGYTPEGIGVLRVDDYCSAQSQEVNSTDSFVSDWTPYILTAEYRCSTFGWSNNEYAERAKRLLEAATPKLLEWEFWGGALSQAAGLDNAFLAEYTGEDYAADSVAKAMGYIENELAACGYGGRGMIHMSPFLLSMVGGGVLRREGNLLLTYRDTIVVPGAGYAPFAQGATPTLEIYGTGLTDVRTGEIIVDDENLAIDRATNTVVVKAQRYAVASWDELCEAKATVTL